MKSMKPYLLLINHYSVLEMSLSKRPFLFRIIVILSLSNRTEDDEDEKKYNRISVYFR